MTLKLTGEKLLETVNSLNEQGVTKSDQCRITGYAEEKPDGSERLCFTEFYTQLLIAKGCELGLEPADPEVEEWETVLSESDQELLEEIKHHIPDCDEDLLKEIKDFGIETPDQFCDSFHGTWESYNNEAEFAQQYYEDLGEIDSNNVLFDFIDWDLVWSCQLRHDFTVIQGVYFFHDHF